MSKPVLYSYFRSGASWRVRIALAHKGIDYEYRPVNIFKDEGRDGEQLTEQYTELNSMRQVPSLVIDGHTLSQSLPIIEYLEETRPEKSLLPKDPIKRLEARRLAEIINSGIQPLHNLIVLMKVEEITGDATKKALWAKQFITLGLQAFEKTLSRTAGKFCIGDDVTIADVCLMPQLFGAQKFGVDMTQFPIITRVAAECNKLQAFQVADAANQPDTPKM